MRIFLFILLSVVLAIAAPVWGQADASLDETPFDNSTLREDGQIIAFVGKKVFVREDENFSKFLITNHKNENGEHDYVLVGSRYEARYEILDLVSGEYVGKTIDFYIYSGGTPRFSKSENILIFIHDGPDSRIHSKYNFYEVHRTTDGDWAACGNAYVQYDPKEEEKNKEPLEPISFLHPVTVNVPSVMYKISDFYEEDEIITDSSRAEAQAEIDDYNKEDNALYQPPIWKRDGDIATCQMGTRVRDLYDFQNQTRFLPDHREEICEARHAEELEALGENHKAKRDLREDCEALLEIQNLP